MKQWKKIAAGALALVLVFGSGSAGTAVEAEEPRAAFDDTFESVISGYGGEYYAAIDTEGGLWMWGNNEDGQIGNGTLEDCLTPVKIMEDVQQAETYYHTMAAIKEDGSLWMWGYNGDGQIGNGTAENCTEPVKVLEQVKEVVLSGGQTAAIQKDGSLWMWGSNSRGELGNGTEEASYVPVKILDAVKTITIGNYYCAAIKEDGSLWMWGANNNGGALGDGTGVSKSAPVKIMDQVREVAIPSNSGNTAVIKEDGSLWAWGFNYNGQLGDGTRIDKESPVKIMENVKSVGLTFDCNYAIKEDGSLWLWGTGSKHLTGATEEESYTPIRVLENVKSAKCINSAWGLGTIAVLKKDGTMWSTKANLQEDGTYEVTYYQMSNLNNVVSFDLAPEEYYYTKPGDPALYWSSRNTVMALKTDGSLWKWELESGNNWKLLSNVQDFKISHKSSAALRKDGSLWSWGSNEYGQLGNGTTERNETPSRVISRKFYDVTADTWYYDAVDYAEEAGIMMGTKLQIFEPAKKLSRAEFATILYRMSENTRILEHKDFLDVAEGEWYTDPIHWANSRSIIEGYGESGLFGTFDKVTREQIATLMYRYAKYCEYDTTEKAELDGYTDVSEVSDYALNAMQWAVAKGLISGKVEGELLDPQGYANRAECAVIIFRFIETFEQ